LILAEAIRCKHCKSDLTEVAPPVVETDHKQCPFCSELILVSAIKCKHCGTDLRAELLNASEGQTPDAIIIRRLADHKKISGAVWAVIGILQIVTGLAAVFVEPMGFFIIFPGILSLTTAAERFVMAKAIRARLAQVPRSHEGMGQLILLAASNLFCGGVIGAFWVAFDFYVRDQVLKNVHLFTEQAANTTTQ